MHASLWGQHVQRVCGGAQVEERLRFYDEGVAPRKNATVMAEAMKEFKDAVGSDDEGDAGAAGTPAAAAGGAGAMDVDGETPKKKSKKKSKGVRLSGAQLCFRGFRRPWEQNFCMSCVVA